jgi:UDP-N-acetyl-D-mannosaminuronate dehydrogenase
VERVDCSIDELEAADLVVVLTAHEDLPYAEIAEHARLVLDTRGSLRGRSFRGQVL